MNKDIHWKGYQLLFTDASSVNKRKEWPLYRQTNIWSNSSCQTAHILPGGYTRLLYKKVTVIEVVHSKTDWVRKVGRKNSGGRNSKKLPLSNMCMIYTWLESFSLPLNRGPSLLVVESKERRNQTEFLVTNNPSWVNKENWLEVLKIPNFQVI